jgi:hypothetical protein
LVVDSERFEVRGVHGAAGVVGEALVALRGKKVVSPLWGGS